MGDKTKKGPGSHTPKPEMAKRNAFKLRGGTGNMNPFAKMSEKGLINPLQERKPATDGGGRVEMEPGRFEKYAMADAGGLRHAQLTARRERQKSKIENLNEREDKYTEKVQQKISKATDRKAKLKEKIDKNIDRREGRRNFRGKRNVALTALATGLLGAEYKDVPQEKYTSISIPAGLDPKQVPNYVNSLTNVRTSTNNPIDPNTGKPITGWVNYNLDPNQPFDYNPQTGEMTFTSTPTHRETGDAIYSRKKLTWNPRTAVERIKKGVDFVKTNIM